MAGGSSTQLVGILNLTPDSFSDGGVYVSLATAVAHVTHMVEEGASVVDVGAESTRPGATPLSPEEEWARLQPMLPTLLREFPNLCWSVDTRHVATAERALDMGVHWVNDVSGAADPSMGELLVQHPQATLVAMHSLSIPADPKQTLASDADPVEAIIVWMQERKTALLQTGINESQLVFDPGIGFGKTAAQSWALVRGIAQIKQEAGVQLLVGHSRKSFLGVAKDAPITARDMATHCVGLWLALRGVGFLRVHDVHGAAEMLRVAAMLGEEQP